MWWSRPAWRRSVRRNPLARMFEADQRRCDAVPMGHDRPMPSHANTLLTKLGFRFGRNGPHAARTMMLDDVRRVFSILPVTASKADYAQAIGPDNLLNKPTKKARELALRHLFTLYGFDFALPLFRVFRRLWESDPTAAPLLALMAALARDPLLRGTQDFILGKHPGETVAREEVEALIDRTHQDRFSAASLKSFAQNVGGTWTQAGYLSGHTRKTRSIPLATPAAAAFALFLAYLEGATGQRLFASSWVALKVDAKAQPFRERLQLDIGVNEDLVLTAQAWSLNQNDRVSYEIHDLEFALTTPGAKGGWMKSKVLDEKASAGGQADKGDLAMRSNLSFREDQSLVPGEVMAQFDGTYFWDWKQPPKVQVEERLFYVPCSVCRRRTNDPLCRCATAGSPQNSAESRSTRAGTEWHGHRPLSRRWRRHSKRRPASMDPCRAVRLPSCGPMRSVNGYSRASVSITMI